jgi:hypothetical protein
VVFPADLGTVDMAEAEKPGGEPVKQNIQVRLEPEDIKKLGKEAERSGHTISSLARLLIKNFLEGVQK